MSKSWVPAFAGTTGVGEGMGRNARGGVARPIAEHLEPLDSMLK
jgi:hypothetical protein